MPPGRTWCNRVVGEKGLKHLRALSACLKANPELGLRGSILSFSENAIVGGSAAPCTHVFGDKNTCNLHYSIVLGSFFAQGNIDFATLPRGHRPRTP